MIDPRTVYVCIPCYKQPEPEVMGAIVSCGGLFAALSTPAECSHVGLARNLAVNAFLGSSYEWFVGIDADTGFSRADFELLLEPYDAGQTYAVSGDNAGGHPPLPSRVLVAQPATLQQIDLKTLGAADALVCAEYSYKNEELAPCKLGMGFVRIHRSVFEALANLTHDGGPTVEVRRDLFERLKDLSKERYNADEVHTLLHSLLETAEDKAGAPRLWQTAFKGRRFYDFFPSGPLLSQFVPTAEWKGEDHGFFTLCMLAGIVPRIETRTRLLHIGRKAYPYLGPGQGGGQ